MRTRFAAVLLSGMLSAAACTLSAALTVSAADDTEEISGTVTVTAYDGETGELFDTADVSLQMLSGAYETKPKYGSFRVKGGWKPSVQNPYTAEITLDPAHNGFFDLCNGRTVNEMPYWYEIDESRSVNAFNFNESTEITADLYIVKHYRAGAIGGFWICCGTTEDGEYPVFRQFYTDESLGSDKQCRRVIYQGKSDIQFAYGDLFTTDAIINPKNGVLANDITWEQTGNCYTLPDIRTMTVGFVNTESTAPAIGLYDEEGNYFRYRLIESGFEPGISLMDVQEGDTVSFAVYEDTAVLPLTAPAHHHPRGDISGDGMLRKEDAELLQSYLLSVPEAVPKDWKAADFDENGMLNAKDLSLLKQAIAEKELKPHCTLTVVTTQNGANIMGEILPTRTHQETFTVYEGDYFAENMFSWEQNPQDRSGQTNRKIVSVDKITADGVTIRCFNEQNEEAEEERADIPYGFMTYAGSLITIYDGYNSVYTLIFSDYTADGTTQNAPPAHAPKMDAAYGKVTAEEYKMLCEAFAKKYPDMDFSDFTLRYEPDSPLAANGKVFSILYKGILLHGYGDLNCDCNIYALIVPTAADRKRVDISFIIDPKLFTETDTEAECLSQKELLTKIDDEYQMYSYPKRILYVDIMHDNELRQAYLLISRNKDHELIADAFTGEEIARISYSVP